VTAGDEVYGRDPTLRSWLESAQVNTSYVLGISKSTPIALATGTRARADAILKTLIASDWVIDSCGTGSKAARQYAWAWAATTDPRRHLLIRRNLLPNAKGSGQSSGPDHRGRNCSRTIRANWARSKPPRLDRIS
jgi:hypothetical protein